MVREPDHLARMSDDEKLLQGCTLVSRLVVLRYRHLIDE